MRRNFGALMEAQWRRRRRKKSYVEGIKRAAEISEEGERIWLLFKKKIFF